MEPYKPSLKEQPLPGCFFLTAAIYDGLVGSFKKKKEQQILLHIYSVAQMGHLFSGFFNPQSNLHGNGLLGYDLLHCHATADKTLVK